MDYNNKNIIELFNNISENIFLKEETVWFNTELLNEFFFEGISLTEYFKTKDNIELFIKKNMQLNQNDFIELSGVDFLVLKLKLLNDNIPFEDNSNYFLLNNEFKKIIIYKLGKLYMPYYSNINMKILLTEKEKKYYKKTINNINNF